MLALGMVLALLAATVGALTVGSALVAAHSARSAADLAALAAAGSQESGQGEPCLEAARVAAAQGARIVSCTVTGSGVAEVVTSFPVRRVIAGLSPAEATGHARAGPAPQATGQR